MASFVLPRGAAGLRSSPLFDSLESIRRRLPSNDAVVDAVRTQVVVLPRPSSGMWMCTIMGILHFIVCLESVCVESAASPWACWFSRRFYELYVCDFEGQSASLARLPFALDVYHDVRVPAAKGGWCLHASPRGIKASHLFHVDLATDEVVLDA